MTLLLLINTILDSSRIIFAKYSFHSESIADTLLLLLLGYFRFITRHLFRDRM